MEGATVRCGHGQHRALALGYAEYGLGLVPLALLAALWRRKDGRTWASILRLVALLGTVTLAWYAIRSGVIGERSEALVAIEPARWLGNAARLVMVSLFWGNSVWTMLGPQPLAAIVTLVAVAAAVVWFALGLDRIRRLQGAAAWWERPDLGLLLPAVVVTTFPMLIMTHVSELYATPILMSVALLAGFAFDGWRSRPGAQRAAGFGLAALAILIGVGSAWGKIDGVRQAGLRTDEQIRQILSFVPDSAKGWRIAILFDPAQTEPRYSVFRQGADWVIGHGAASATLRWFRPEQGLQLKHVYAGSQTCAELAQRFDLVLKWNAARSRFQPLSLGEEREQCIS